MSELERRKLTDTEVAESLALRAGWTIEDGMLTRLFEFPAYKDGVVFATAVAWIADGLDHHPDLFIGYRKVRVSTITHDRDGLTPLDFELAKRIDGLGASS